MARRDYFELTKPKVVLLMLVTVLVGMYLATDSAVPLDTLIYTLLGLSCGMGGAAAINHVVDQHTDRLMKRTGQRPIAAGRLNAKRALIFAITLCTVSILILDIRVNRLTALLTLCGVMGYAVVYTRFLKRSTPQNIVIGGLAGAIPPLLGWTAVTNNVHPYALLLVLIIFVWTPPHFWALAVHRHEEYAKADIPMLPVTHGTAFTKSCVWLYTWLMVAATLLPFATGMSGAIYLSAALVLNSIFVYYAALLKWREAQHPGIAMKTFGYSIIYLFALFISLLIDHYYRIG
ncbi:MAG: heme o synthase [Gammaproteobacteria bacterium]